MTRERMSKTVDLEQSVNELPFYLKADFYRAKKGVEGLGNSLLDSNEGSLPFSGANLQALVRDTFPDLWEFAQTISKLLRSGVTAIVVENLPFAQIDLRRSKLAFLAFASCIGLPTSVDPHSGTRVWEVRPRWNLPQAYTPTITEHNGGAELHTDSSFKLTPERYVLLLAYRPASDGGGITQLLSSDLLLAQLSTNNAGTECIRLLNSCALPYRVPTIFTKNRRDSDVEWVAAPILSNQPTVRYRYDLIASAVKCVPIILSSDVEWALSHFRKELQKLTPRSVALDSGDLLIINNHLALHGRTSFEDSDRVLLRVRLSNTQ